MTESVGFATAFAGQSSSKSAKSTAGEAPPRSSAAAPSSTKTDANNSARSTTSTTERTGPGTTPDAGTNGASGTTGRLTVTARPITSPSTIVSTGTTTGTKITTASSPSPAFPVSREDLDADQIQIQRPSASRPAKGNTLVDAASAANSRPQDHDNNSSDPPSTLHSHRQDHNSSKLPAFRFADLKGGPSVSSFSAQHLRLHNHHAQHLIRPSPSSTLPNPVPGPEPREPPAAPSTRDSASVANTEQNGDEATTHSDLSKPPSTTTDLPPRASLRPRISTYQPSPLSRTLSASSLPPTGGEPPIVKQRSASCPEPGAVLGDRSPLYKEPGGAHDQSHRRALDFRSCGGAHTTTRPPTTLTSHRLQTLEAVARGAETPATPASPGHRELLLPKRLSNSSSSDESRRATSYVPSLTYKPTSKRHSIQPGNITPGRVPPIRSFRSSGSRKSLTKDMNFTPRPYDLGDNYENYERNGNDDTLRGLEDRYGDNDFEAQPVEDPEQLDDNGDVFLRLAREEPSVELRGEDAADDSQSSVSRIRHSLHRRPLSTAVVNYHPASPPRLRRRLSDQQEGPRPRYLEDDQATETSRTSAYRPLVREKAASVHPGDDTIRTRSGGVNLRPSPLSARSVVGSDANNEQSVYARRRASVTESNSVAGARGSTYRPSGFGHGHSRNYGSSPLGRSVDYQNRGAREPAHGMEGTESTASTTAPSTVWDELDELKSRINRLELTGKLPSTSGAAVSRLTDGRPATATTTVTTMSLSPKRQGALQAAEATSTTSSQREAHHSLHSTLIKSKPYLSPEIYRALEAAANDAMAMSSMMGSPCLPSMASGAASTVGPGAAVTDRQLRRKADSVCRSLTELCVALGDDVSSTKYRSNQSVVSPVLDQTDGPATPTIPKSYSGLPTPRRASIAAEQGTPNSNSSPRPLSKFEERRSLILNGPVSSPRASGSVPSTPLEPTASGRRSSLLVSRTRRADSEDPEIGRTQSLLRSRRTGPEEPEEGRHTSFLRNRRGTVGEDTDAGRARPSSRAGTEVNMTRTQAFEYAPARERHAPPVSMSHVPSGLPRRRFLSTNVQSPRFTDQQGSTPSPTRYGAQPAAELEMSDNSIGAAATPAKSQQGLLRQGSLRQALSHIRASSLSTRRNRDSIVSTNGGSGGEYR